MTERDKIIEDVLWIFGATPNVESVTVAWKPVQQHAVWGHLADYILAREVHPGHRAHVGTSEIAMKERINRIDSRLDGIDTYLDATTGRLSFQAHQGEEIKAHLERIEAKLNWVGWNLRWEARDIGETTMFSKSTDPEPEWPK